MHWQHQPVALTPQPETADADGCWSGCTVIDAAGTPTILYTGSAGGNERPCLATGSADLLTWQPSAANPVIAAPPPGLDVVGFRDPYVWRAGDDWYLALGSGLRDVGGAVLLYRSRDLHVWDYLHPLCVGDATDGTMWECPNFFPLGDKHVLIISIIPTREVVAFVGTYANGRFTPERRQVLDGGQTFYAPQVFRDATGRTLLFGWLAEERSDALQRAAGWSGALSLPRVLTLAPDGSLRQASAPEIAHLYGSELPVLDVAASPDTPIPLLGHQSEITLNLPPQTRVEVTLTPFGTTSPFLRLTYNPTQAQLVLHLANDETPRAVSLILDAGTPCNCAASAMLRCWRSAPTISRGYLRVSMRKHPRHQQCSGAIPDVDKATG